MYHSITLPSLRNSGFVITSNPLPDFFLDVFSINGLITLAVVLGTTVLFTTIIGFFEECRREIPMFFAAFLIILKSMKPDFDFGVPTVLTGNNQLRVRTPADPLYPQEWDDWVKVGLLA